MKIRVLRLGSGAQVVDCEPGTTIGDALRQVNFGTDGFRLAINGLDASTDTSVADGDVIVMTPKVVGGVAPHLP